VKARPATLNVAVLDDYQDVARTYADWASLADAKVTTYQHSFKTPDDLVDALSDCSVAVLMRERSAFGGELLDRLPNLRLIVTTGMANAALDVEAATARGLTVCGTRAVGANTVEHTWALILSLARHIPEEDANIRQGGWQRTVGFDLKGKTLGLLGLGRIGSAVAKIGTSFGMQPIAWSQNLTPQVARERGAEWVSRAGLFEQADVLSVHLVLSERTTSLVGAADLARMRRTALLVNTSRSRIVDSAALLDALRAERIGGAALDVFDTEPLSPDDAWRSCPRTVLTPHLGYVTEKCYSIFYRDALEDIVAWREGAPVRQLN
jgi:phosphoglycerate dehydrogenase-like enzyme